MNIVGRLTENAQVQTLSNGKQVVNFSVAVNDNYRNKAGENVQQTSFLTVLIGSVRGLLRILPKAHWLNWKDEYRQERGSIVRENLKQA